jgi:hypothetical protein
MSFRKINVTNLDTLTVNLSDSLILMNQSLDSTDTGFLAYKTATELTGLIRDSQDSHYYLIESYTGSVDTNNIDPLDASITLGDLNLQSLTTNAIYGTGNGTILVGNQINLGTNRIINIGAPLLNNDAATKIYVDTEVSNAIQTAIATIVDSAPETLDTLNEIAAALGDDPTFLASISNTVDNLATVATSGSYNDLTDTPVSIVQTTTNTTDQTLIFSFAHSSYKSARITASIDDGTDVTTADVVIASNGTVASISVYGITNTNSTLATFDVSVSGADVNVYATAASAVLTTFNMVVSLV